MRRGCGCSTATANRASEVELPTLGTITALGGEWDGDELFFGFQSLTMPQTVYRLDLKTGRRELYEQIKADIDFAAYEVEQVSYKSKDGTPVTMFLAHKKGLKPDGRTPTLLYGYGGFNLSMTPSFNATRFLFLERGGLLAVANLRGGGEYGEEWHQAGMLDKKQNVFDDFIAAAEWLIDKKYTDRDHLAIQGGSNGGLLVGAALTQRPDLFRAVVCQVPLLDMLRYHKFLIARLWIPEYGSGRRARRTSAGCTPTRRITTSRTARSTRGAAGDGRIGYARRCPARTEDGGAASGGDGVGERAADPAADRDEGGTRGRQAARETLGGVDGYLEFSVLAIAHAGMTVATSGLDMFAICE